MICEPMCVETDWVSSSIFSSHYFLKQALIEPGAHQFDKTNWLSPMGTLLSLSFSRAEIVGACHRAQLFMWVLRSLCSHNAHFTD